MNKNAITDRRSLVVKRHDKKRWKVIQRALSIVFDAVNKLSLYIAVAEYLTDRFYHENTMFNSNGIKQLENGSIAVIPQLQSTQKLLTYTPVDEVD
jgi:hypothetical protein